MLGAVDDHARLQAVLRPDEQLLWLGRPDPRLWFTGADVFLVPFSVLWYAFATLFEVAESRGGAFFAALGVPFIAAGLYLVVGRFFYKPRTACAAALLRWLHVVVTRQVSWDPVIAAGGTSPLRTAA